MRRIVWIQETPALNRTMQSRGCTRSHGSGCLPLPVLAPLARSCLLHLHAILVDRTRRPLTSALDNSGAKHVQGASSWIILYQPARRSCLTSVQILKPSRHLFYSILLKRAYAIAPTQSTIIVTRPAYCFIASPH